MVEKLSGIEQKSEYNGPIVDTHSHFMPHMDDGSLSMEMSMEMLRVAEKEGVTDLFETSHGDHVCEISEVYEETFQQLKENTQKEGIGIHLYKGCEVFVN